MAYIELTLSVLWVLLYNEMTPTSIVYSRLPKQISSLLCSENNNINHIPNYNVGNESNVSDNNTVHVYTS